MLLLLSTAATKMGNNLTTALVLIFAISLLTLVAELFYVFCRRRRRRADTIRGGGDQISSPESNSSPLASSKAGLLRCFCGRADSEAEIRNSGQQSEMEVVDIELLKIQGMFGPPRFLFTIDEDEKEELESPAGKYLRAGSGAKMDDDRVSLEEHFEIDVFGGDDATPFSTPCASPVYFTPSVSPVHEVVVVVVNSPEKD